MTINYPDILDLKTKDVQLSWNDRDVMLYALGVGMGENPLNPDELPFVYEKALRVLPSFATIVAYEAAPRPDGLRKTLVLDGGREVIIHKPLTVAADVIMNGNILSVTDKGPEKGAIIKREVVIADAQSGEKIATVLTNVFACGDGGFGGPSENGDKVYAVPERAPDHSIDIGTRPNQALLYRLCGDRNPLHSDPAVAAIAGFDKPILHGLCTYGICCRAVLQTYTDYDPTLIARFGARFSAPCFPGETLSIDLWRDGNEISFQARVASRSATVIKNGYATLRL